MDEPLSGADSDEILREYQAWCYKRAWGMTDPDFVEDLAQEGLLAMWQALHTYDPAKGALPAWLTKHATWRMREVVSGDARLTSSENGRHHNGHGILNYVNEQRRTAPMDTRPQPGEPEPTPVGTPPAPLEDYATSAYHRGQIIEAINQLPPSQREYVYLRFWRDYRKPEMTSHFGYDPTSGMWNNPKRGAKVRLREALAGLDDAPELAAA